MACHPIRAHITQEGAGSTKEEPEWGVMEAGSGRPEEGTSRLLRLRVWMHTRELSGPGSGQSWGGDFHSQPESWGPQVGPSVP